MRLWHSKLIPILDNKRLCDVHMSCCNLRGNGWGKRNVAINYLYDDPLGEEALVEYHYKVLNEMEYRGMEPDENWFDPNYCGKNRQARTCDQQKLEEAHRRNIPLLGHTMKLFINDLNALQERGLDIQVRAVKCFTRGEYVYKYEVAREGTVIKGEFQLKCWNFN